MTEQSVLLTGFDGTNPLGFLAALGVLRTLHEQALAMNSLAPRLSWENNGRWLPRLWGMPDIEAVIEAVLEDLKTWESEPALELAYGEDGNFAVQEGHGNRDSGDGGTDASESSAPEAEDMKRADKKPGAETSSKDKIKRDLKPKPEVLRTFLSGLVESSHLRRERSLSVAAAFGTETAIDNKGNVKPTAFHFTAGNQAFLSMVRQLRDRITRNDIEEALVGPWTKTSMLPSLSWDASDFRIYALRATNPAPEKRGSVPAANWLAFVALQFFPVAPVGSQVVTPCVAGGWKGARFRWPLWHVALAADTAASLLRMGRFAGDGRGCRELGIATVMEAGISRSEQGGYGSFSPAVVLL